MRLMYDKVVNVDCRATSPHLEIPATLVLPCIQNVSQKNGEASPPGYTHGKVAQRSLKDQVEWLHLRPCLVQSICWPWCTSSSISRAAARATLPKGKASMKMNEVW